MSILNFLRLKSNSTITDEQKASHKLFELIYEGKSSSEEILELSHTIYRLAFKRTNKEFVNPNDIMNPRNLIGNPNRTRLLNYFAVFKAILNSLSGMPNNPIHMNSQNPEKYCDALLEAILEKASENLSSL